MNRKEQPQAGPVKMRKKHVRWVQMSAICLLIIVLAGCQSAPKGIGNADNSSGAASSTGASSSNASSSGKAANAAFNLGALVNQEQVSNFNPFLATGNWNTIFDYLYNPLYYFNPVKGVLVPELAKGPGAWSDNKLDYTVKLNTKAKWQDGKAFTAADVLYTYKALKDHKTLDRYQLWGDGRLKDVVDNGDGSVTFKLSNVFPSLPYYLSTVYIVPKHIFSSQDPTKFLNKKPIGTGPFVYKSLNQSAIILDRNSDYFMGAPHIARLVIKRYNNAPTLTLALEKGDIQASTGTIAMPSLPKLKEDPNNKVQVYPGLNTFSVIINNDKPGLKDPVVRRAIQQAIDRKTLIDKGEMGAVFPANPGFMSTIFGEMADKSLINDAKYSFNIKAAQQALEADGYKKNSKGIYQKNGKSLSFTYNMAANAPAQNKEGAMITQWLKQVGIETKVKLVTWPELTKLMMSGQYDLLQDGIRTPPDPQANMEVFASSMTAPIGTNTPGLNYMRFRDAKVDQWLKQASSADKATRKTLYYKIQKEIADQAPIAVMYNVGNHIPYRVDKFTNYDMNAPVSSALSLMQVKAK